jgi:hypothetical protein
MHLSDQPHRFVFDCDPVIQLTSKININPTIPNTATMTATRPVK